PVSRSSGRCCGSTRCRSNTPTRSRCGSPAPRLSAMPFSGSPSSPARISSAGPGTTVARPWGPTLQSDQIISGGALWILGDLVGLPFLAAQLIQLIREDESDAARIDAELDAREAAAAVTAEGEQDGEKPWWED